MDHHHHPLAGRIAPRALLVDVPGLVAAYYTRHPDPSVVSERVAFGTSGHRGSALKGAFNEDHIVAITQAICIYRKQKGLSGPLFLGKDTHALSEPARITALEVLAANGVEVMIDLHDVTHQRRSSRTRSSPTIRAVHRDTPMES